MESVFRVIHSCTKHAGKGLINAARGVNILNSIQRRATFSSLEKEIATFRPRRSLLFVPADDRKKINKASNLQADCIVLECEDGVAMSQKDVARKNINELLGNIELKYGECAVRVNSVDSGLVLEDIEAALTGKTLPESILLPKVESSDQIKWFADQVNRVLMKRSTNPEKKMAFIFFIETPIAILNMRYIMEAAVDATLPFKTEAGVFGSDDFLASLGGTRTEDARELIFARQSFVTHCKAFGLQAIDMVHINFKDLESLKRHAEEGAKMGFTGKQLIHPGQIEVVNSAFMPSANKIQWAQELIKSFGEHESSGKGAFTFRGSMIDLPLLKQAQNILRIVESVKNK
ncbi:citramalyl-CoA lyase, mitochondrial-like [Rhopilema esculentum]|uniref:citramalyl-CoA lyase, mitochondrial-like n=1 Tax=Rhopilema esculentum TaxID=499914 RepID=UPI0031D2C662|eukprot:gene15116-6297_t